MCAYIGSRPCWEVIDFVEKLNGMSFLSLLVEAVLVEEGLRFMALEFMRFVIAGGAELPGFHIIIL